MLCPNIFLIISNYIFQKPRMFICESHKNIFLNEMSVESCVLHASNTTFQHSIVWSILNLWFSVLFLVLCLTKTIDNNLITTLIIKRVMKMKAILISELILSENLSLLSSSPCHFISYSDRIFKVNSFKLFLILIMLVFLFF